MSTKRHQARQDAFCLLFEKTFTDEDIDQIIEGATQTRDLQVDRFTLDLAKGTVEHMQEIDALIEPKLKTGSSLACLAFPFRFCAWRCMS